MKTRNVIFGLLAALMLIVTMGSASAVLNDSVNYYSFDDIEINGSRVYDRGS